MRKNTKTMTKEILYLVRINHNKEMLWNSCHCKLTFCTFVKINICQQLQICFPGLLGSAFPPHPATTWGEQKYHQISSNINYLGWAKISSKCLSTRESFILGGLPSLLFTSLTILHLFHLPHLRILFIFIIFFISFTSFVFCHKLSLHFMTRWSLSLDMGS